MDGFLPQDVTALHPVLSVALVGGVLAGGVVLLAVLDAALHTVVAGRGTPGRRLVGAVVGRAALLWVERGTVTERPDAVLWLLAPGFYAACAAAAVAVVPLADGVAAADVRSGIVVFGAVEALTMVAVYLHGWSADSYVSLIGAYRFVAMVLSTLLISMFVLIAAALPAVYPVVAGIALLGVLITAALFLQMLQQLFFGELPDRWKQFSDLRSSESATLGVLLALTVLVGVYPRWLLDVIDAASSLLVGG